jgi:hypothetical protein
VVVHITRKYWSPKFCGSYAPLNLKISRNILLKQLVSTTPLKLLNRISWNLVGSNDTICGCAYTRKFWSPKFCESYAPLNLKNSRNILLKQLVSSHYYLPSFMKFCSVVSKELCWQAASEVYFGKFLSSKGHNSHNI